MKPTPNRKVLWGIGTLLFLPILLACANYLAGAILFLSYGENPAQAQFLTIERAYQTAPNARALAKVRGSAALSLVLCLALPFGLAMLLRRKKNEDSELFGTARFANAADIAGEKLDAPKGLVLGKFKGKLLRLPGYEFVLLAAPTRTGKGVGFCVPNLLQFEQSAVVLDIKGENYNLTSEFRRRYMGNEIFYFNPFSDATHRWNPLSYISEDPNFRANDLLALATIIYPPNEKEPFWPDSARNLFVGLGLLVLETPELPSTIGEILRQASGFGQPIEEYLGHVVAVRTAGPTPLSVTCRDSLNRFLGSGETALKGIVATFTAALTPFANPVIDKATSGNDFDLRDVRKKKMTIYLNIPAGDILQAGFIVNMFFSQLINENVKELPEQNPDLRYQCVLLLDEFTAMGKVAIIAKGVGYMAGYNMRLAIIIQDKAQLDAVYGKEDAHNIISNMGAVIYFTPSQINEAEEYSKMIGNNTVSSFSKQHGKSSLFGLKGEGGGDSQTESYQSRALMLPQELLAMSKDAELVVRSGIPVIKADKIRYFSDPYFKERFEAVPMQSVAIGGEQRKVPVPVPRPVGEWTDYRAAVANSDFYARQPTPATGAEAAPEATAAPSAPQAPAGPLELPGATWVEPAAPPLEESHTIPAATNYALASARALVAYARSLAMQATPDAQPSLDIIDLQPGDGRFAWQVLGFLQQLAAESTEALPELRYLACADDERQCARLLGHAYFAGLADAGQFDAVPRDELRDQLLARRQDAGAGRALAGLAHCAAGAGAQDWAAQMALLEGSPYLLLASEESDPADPPPSLARLGAELERRGALVWQQGGPRLQLAVLGAAPAARHEAMDAICAALGQAKPSAARAPGLAPALAWLAQANDDPLCLEELLPELLATDWRGAPAAAPHWRQALLRAWNLILPQPQQRGFLLDLARLALALHHPGLAREAALHAHDAGADATAALLLLAEAGERSGRIEDAVDALEQALVDAPGNPAAITYLQRLTQRLRQYQALAWYERDSAQETALWIEPLGEHHAGALLARFGAGIEDGDAMRPGLHSESEAADWIAAWLAAPAQSCCAFMDEDQGLVAVATMTQVGALGRIDVLDGVQDGTLAEALALFMDMTEQAEPVEAVFSVVDVAGTSGALLEAAGFIPLDAGDAFAQLGLAVCFFGELEPAAARERFDAGAAQLGLGIDNFNH